MSVLRQIHGRLNGGFAAADANYMMAQLFFMAVNIQADLVLGLYVAVFIPAGRRSSARWGLHRWLPAQHQSLRIELLGGGFGVHQHLDCQPAHPANQIVLEVSQRPLEAGEIAVDQLAAQIIGSSQTGSRHGPAPPPQWPPSCPPGAADDCHLLGSGLSVHHLAHLMGNAPGWGSRNRRSYREPTWYHGTCCTTGRAPHPRPGPHRVSCRTRVCT